PPAVLDRTGTQKGSRRVAVGRPGGAVSTVRGLVGLADLTRLGVGVGPGACGRVEGRTLRSGRQLLVVGAQAAFGVPGESDDAVAVVRLGEDDAHRVAALGRDAVNR